MKGKPRRALHKKNQETSFSDEKVDAWLVKKGGLIEIHENVKGVISHADRVRNGKKDDIKDR